MHLKKIKLAGTHADTKTEEFCLYHRNGVGFRITTSIVRFKQPFHVLKIGKKCLKFSQPYFHLCS